MATRVEIRSERPADAEGIRRVNDEAFGGAVESGIVDAVRREGQAVVSLVAVADGEIAGHILFTPVTIDSPGRPVRAVGLAPMCVTPPRQRQGIGGLLVRHGLDACARAGFDICVVVGHPGYYPRFGFQPGAPLGLRWEVDVPEDVFMVAALAPGALAGVRGVVRYLQVFDIH